MATSEGRDIARAFLHGERCSRKRTTTDGVIVELLGSVIARQDTPDGVPVVTLAGWPTVTTKDRVNSILDTFGADWRFCTRKGELYTWRWATNELYRVDSTDWLPVSGPLTYLALRASRGLSLVA